jgi:redox-sensitive bicupin YhaK (pirin superfamily)
MQRVRRREDRGHANHGWLETWHSFSFGDYYDPAHQKFRSLRVINEDFIAPRSGFPTHPHRDMEILTYVLAGELTHKDSMGTVSSLKAGEFQRMSAGTGVTHSEENLGDLPVHLLQIWVLPERRALAPSYEERQFSDDDSWNTLQLLAAPGGPEGAMNIHADLRLYRARLRPSTSLRHPVKAGRGCWLQVVRGELSVAGQALRASDGIALEDLESVEIRAGESDCEFLLFDLA